MDYKKLEELNNLHQSGTLTEEEFEREKQKLFAADEQTTATANPNIQLPMGLKENIYLTLMNLLILIPYIGWILPVILWSMGKSKSEKINIQGKHILNWYICWASITLIVGAIVFIMIVKATPADISNPFYLFVWLMPVASLLGILAIVFPIIGGLEGLNHRTWKYPLTISFLK